MLNGFQQPLRPPKLFLTTEAGVGGSAGGSTITYLAEAFFSTNFNVNSHQYE